MVCAERYGWTDYMTDACDPDFLFELQQFWLAQDDHETNKEERRKRERERARRRAR